MPVLLLWQRLKLFLFDRFSTEGGGERKIEEFQADRTLGSINMGPVFCAMTLFADVSDLFFHSRKNAHILGLRLPQGNGGTRFAAVRLAPLGLCAVVRMFVDESKSQDCY